MEGARVIYLFSILIWFPLIHGTVLWIALRFKDKKWRWYWFSGVLLVGWGAIWIDALYVKFVIIEGYCKQEDKLGYFDYQPADADAKDVIWLDTPEAKSTTPHANEDFPWINNPEIFYCLDQKSKKENYCTVKNLKRKYESETYYFDSWKSTKQLWRGEHLVSEHVMYRWAGWRILRAIGFPKTSHHCSGPDRGTSVHHREFYPGMYITINVR